MATIEDLIGIQEPIELIYPDIQQINPNDLNVRYDPIVDSFILYFTNEPVKSEHVDLDDNVSVLVELNSDKVVGFDVYAWKHSFLPKHPDIQKIWSIQQNHSWNGSLSSFGYTLLMLLLATFTSEKTKEPSLAF